jgi:hypothetical protein
MDVQLNAKVKNQDRAERGKDESGGMKSPRYRARKHVSHGAADDRSDDAEHDCPENRHVHVHHLFRDDAGDQSNNDVPNQMKHNFPPSFACRKWPSMAKRFAIEQTFRRQIFPHFLIS